MDKNEIEEHKKECINRFIKATVKVRLTEIFGKKDEIKQIDELKEKTND